MYCIVSWTKMSRTCLSRKSFLPVSLRTCFACSVLASLIRNILCIINCLLSQWKSCCSTAHDSSCDICLDTCTPPRISVNAAEGFCLFRAVVGKDSSALTHSSTRVRYAARGCPISHPRFRIGKRVPWSTPPRKLIVSPRFTKGLVLFIRYQYLWFIHIVPSTPPQIYTGRYPWAIPPRHFAMESICRGRWGRNLVS